MKSLLKPNGTISILDYNHNTIEWNPKPPKSMETFYSAFLKWRADAGMNNGIADDLVDLMKEAGLQSIEKINSDEFYGKDRSDFITRVGIWSKVATLQQIVEEGYITEESRLKAIEEYDTYVKEDAVSMTMKLNEVRGTV